MQDTQSHKGFLDRVRGFIIEDLPDDDPGQAAAETGARVVPPAAGERVRGKSDDVDQMFADIEAEVSGKPGAPAIHPRSAPAAAPPPAAADARTPSDLIPPDAMKVLKLIESLPAVLTKDQIQPVLAATMEAANLDLRNISAQVETAKAQTLAAIEGAQQETARLEREREETLGRLQSLMEAARSQCEQAVAAQQGRIAGLNSASQTLDRVGSYLPAVESPGPTEKRP